MQNKIKIPLVQVAASALLSIAIINVTFLINNEFPLPLTYGTYEETICTPFPLSACNPRHKLIEKFSYLGALGNFVFWFLVSFIIIFIITKAIKGKNAK